MKNFILIHLESVSELILKMNPELFPNLNKIICKSTYYKNYYSSATSTLMVMSDLCYGGMYREKCTKLETDYNEVDGHNSIFDELEEEGYKCKGIIWPKITTYSKIVNGHILGKNMEVDATGNYDFFVKCIEKSIAEEHAFALFIGNYVSHISYRNDKEIKGSNSRSRWREGYRLVDDTCKMVFELLEKYGKKENTVVILYGDHGDDYWGHRLHNGYTHAIEPYSNIIHTPLVVWNPMDEQRVDYEILSTLDIKDKALNLLQGKSKQTSRKHAFSRNVYVNQENDALSLSKGYAVVSDNYILIVSIRGLELYDEGLDPTNTCNLLEFYHMEKNGNIRFSPNFQKLKSMHFKDYFTDREIRHLREKYLELRKYLLDETERLYKAAEKDRNVRDKELDFKSINRTHFFNIYNSAFIKKMNKCFWNWKQL